MEHLKLPCLVRVNNWVLGNTQNYQLDGAINAWTHNELVLLLCVEPVVIPGMGGTYLYTLVDSNGNLRYHKGWKLDTEMQQPFPNLELV